MNSRLDQAYDACEEIVRAQGRNFAYAIGLLAEDERRALSAIYALARRIDDIADGLLPAEDKRRLLTEARAGLPWRREPDPLDPVLVAVGDAARRFELPVEAFDDLIDGVESDVRDVVSYETSAELVGYCRQVAGSIGRLVVAVLGSDGDGADALADDLGVAFQLTNILRDVLEDRESGRVYLPRAELSRFGCPPDPLQATTEAFTRFVRDQAAQNRAWYARARPVISRLDPRAQACVTAMTGVYERILERIEQDPRQVLRGPVGLTDYEKARIASAAVSHLNNGVPWLARSG